MISSPRLTLVILAAGMGSRYGGLKQLDMFTPEGDTIIDFSLFDALRAGFNKFVFIIRKEFAKDFIAEIESKVGDKAVLRFVFQEVDSVPEKYINPDRIKPWGTGHALLMAREAIHENFAVINADDFYGKASFKVMAETLRDKDQASYEFNSMSYLLKNTISEYGHVSRGECAVDENGFLVDVTERVQIEKKDGQLVTKDERGELVPIDENTIVSMNFWGFTPKFFEFGETLFEQFLRSNRDNPQAEFYIPYLVNEILKSGKARVKVLQSDAKWFGVTYKKDKETVKLELEKLKAQGVYPLKLWQ